MPTDLYHIIKLLVDDKFRWLNTEKVTPWACMEAQGLHISFCRSERKINYGDNIQYANGSPEKIFWSDGFMPLCLETVAEEVFDKIGDMCQGAKLEPASYLEEAADLLKELVRKVYAQMAETDRGLRGRGHPSTVEPRDVSQEIQRAKSMIEAHLKAKKLLLGCNPEAGVAEGPLPEFTPPDPRPNEKPIWTWKEIAKVLACSESTAKKTLKPELEKAGLISRKKTGKPSQLRVYAFGSQLQAYRSYQKSKGRDL